MQVLLTNSINEGTDPWGSDHRHVYGHVANKSRPCHEIHACLLQKPDFITPEIPVGYITNLR